MENSNRLGKIIETDCFDEIRSHITENTAIFFDLDNTLVEPVQHFGSVQWGEHFEKRLLETGKSLKEVEAFLQPYWNGLLPDLSMRLLDQTAPNIIRELQQKGHLVLGLTARDPMDAIYTHPLLDQIGIRFESEYADQKISMSFPAIFERGVLFTGIHNSKGESLVALLKQINHFPQKVLFVDDKLNHVQSLEGPLAELNIDYIGVRYSKADKRVQEFDAQIADLQMQHFPKFISDEEAREMLSPA
ncbi:MAG: DUF2608 domain-containing protein [Parachlamydiaceae bacterium]|nr:DUF2608 domain-containing protein [Parachlamydiaceae bacterium]